MKQRNIIAVAIALCAIGAIAVIICLVSRSSSITIEGRIIGAHNNTIYLERHDGITQNAIDTLKLEPRGEFIFKILDAPKELTLYELKSGDNKIPLLAKQGDKINVNSLGDISMNYLVEGSPESELLRSFYQEFLKRANKLKLIASAYATKQHNNEDTEPTTISYNNLYKEIKQEQLRFIIENKNHIAAIYALMQLLPGDKYLVNETSDLIYQRTVAEAVEAEHPDSPYLNFLKLIITEREAQIELLKNINIANYPEIKMNDRFGKEIELSSLNGEVILLDFWSSKLSESNRNNAELKEIYSKYHERGFEVYQVGIADSKSEWIQAIHSQRLPWISVSDLRGNNSPALRLYNVSSLPFNILISAEGEIVGRNIFSTELSQAIEREVNKKQAQSAK